MIVDPQFLQAALLSIAIGVLFAQISRQASRKYRERKSDLREVEKALRSHFDAMEKIISSVDVPDEIKIPMYLVTNSLDQKDVAIAVCNTVTSAERPSSGAFDFAAAVDRLRETNSEIAQEIDTAMSSAMFVFMLRWPETSKRFKHFVVTTMMNERQELNVFSKISEVAREKSNKAGALSERFGKPIMPTYQVG